MKITCTNCNQLHTLTKNEENLVSKKLPFTMLTCSNCGLGFGLHSDQVKKEEEEEEEEEEVWRSPIPGCEGYVSKVNDNGKAFYGCGETGQIWQTKNELFKAIDSIIKKHPHRQKCYTKIKDNWVHNENEPDDMDEIIQTKEKQ